MPPLKDCTRPPRTGPSSIAVLGRQAPDAFTLAVAERHRLGLMHAFGGPASPPAARPGVLMSSQIPACPRCRRRHLTWHRLAMCRFRAAWATNGGPWASVSFCPRGTTVQSYATEAEARAAKAAIDKGSCGGACVRHHRVIDLRLQPQRRPAARQDGGRP